MESIIGKTIEIVEIRGNPNYLKGQQGIVEKIDNYDNLHGTWGIVAINLDDDKILILN